MNPVQNNRLLKQHLNPLSSPHNLYPPQPLAIQPEKEIGTCKMMKVLKFASFLGPEACLPNVLLGSGCTKHSLDFKA